MARRFTTRRTRKVRPSITAQAKPARRPGTCNGCGGKFNKGEDITYVRVRIKRYHTQSCVPPNVTNPLQSTGPAPRPNTPMESTLDALLGMENALVVKARSSGITPEMDKAFQKYQKCKALGLHPQTDNEGRVAIRMAILELVKLVF